MGRDPRSTYNILPAVKQVSGDGTKFKRIDGENHCIKILPSDDLAKLDDVPVPRSSDPSPSLHRRFVRLAADHFHCNRHLESHLTNLLKQTFLVASYGAQRAAYKNFF